MKNLTRIVLLAALLAATTARAQSAQQVQDSPTHLDAASLSSTSATSAATITITPPAGNYVYITNLEITNCAGTTVTAAAPTTITSTNLSGAAWTIGSGATAGICQPSAASGSFSAGWRSSTPGTAVTFVLPTFVTQQTIRVTAYYYFAP